ncbi:UDP-glucose 4-epimerase GalE [Chromohalobacter israelensis]|uniref:UDP-glucose 4-epimerase GalE n=1 Tax=Chromohalobacter israelensis TaxID=141390 RepID=UPI0005538F0F|nr:UDP-glucose 4-epimerase GalE [Chromohalobacter israelensis]MDF9435904.1 UDP-glucose 4-epimerase GalE [Chromohalobacter israelensis]
MPTENTILVTGGTGYIGSHTVVELLKAGNDVVVVDNLCNSSKAAISRVEKITGKKIDFIQADIRDRKAMDTIFVNYDIDAVIHFAGLKAVGESVGKPLTYYENNVYGTLVLCQAMEAAGVRRIVFSSSATVYGHEAPVPYVETMPRGATSNPYGTSKAMVEKLLEDLVEADERWSVVLLRYFNPIGAHPSGLIGEDPRDVPNNLMPFIAQVAIGRRNTLTIFGDDYDTADGTCERDYLHVVDLAVGHLKALKALSAPGVAIYNLGTGKGISVYDMVNSFVRVTGVDVPYRVGARRAGDLGAFWADASKAKRELGWAAEKSLDTMMADTWNWQVQNPNGYS